MILATTVTSRASVLALFAALQCACSSSTNGGPAVIDAGRSGPLAVPQAVVTSRIGPTASKPAQCSATKPVIWTIGPSPVKDGDSQNGSVVSVACKVAGDASAGFDVVATATLQGQGTVSISGHFTGGSEPQSGMTGRFVDASGLGSFVENDCVVSFATGSQGIASGRVWGTLACPNETDAKSSAICDGEAELRFETARSEPGPQRVFAIRIGAAIAGRVLTSPGSASCSPERRI